MLIGCGFRFDCSFKLFCWLSLLSATCTLMHIVQGLYVCLSVSLLICLFLSLASLCSTLSLLHRIAVSTVNTIVLRRGISFGGIATSLPPLSHHLCGGGEALQWMNNICLLERSALLLRGSTPTGQGQQQIRNHQSSHLREPIK